jgi:hypothetical protein
MNGFDHHFRAVELDVMSRSLSDNPIADRRKVRVNAANKSYQNRNRIVSAASAMECHIEVRTEYQ